MLRYMLLAGAAAIAVPCASLAQVQWSQPLAGENNASSVMNQGGPLDSETDYDIPFNQSPTGVNATDYNPPATQDQLRSAHGYMPDESDDATAAQSPQPGNGVDGSQPSGGYYYSNQGDQALPSADPGVGPQPASYIEQQGAYDGQPGAPRAYVGQGQGSYESTTAGQGLGGEGTYQQGQTYGGAPSSRGYTSGNYSVDNGQQGSPNQPYSGNAQQGYGGGGYYSGQQGSPNQPYPGNAPADQGYGGGYYSGQQGSPNQPYPGNAPADQGYGGGYYSGQQGSPNQPYAAQPQGAYGGQSGYYTGQPNSGQVQNYPSQGGEAYNDQSASTANVDRQVVVVPADVSSARRYVRKTTMASIYEIEAARIALHRSQSPEVRDFAAQMIQNHRQGLAVITQAAAQAGVPQRLMLDQAHRAMLHRLVRAPDADFDRVYTHQQLVAHMNAAAVQAGYLRNGDNPVLQQAAAQLNPIVQQHLNQTYAMSDLPQRLAEQRNSELAMLDQNSGRGQTFRGYTVIGPTAGQEATEGGVGYSGQPEGQYQGGQYQGGQDQGDQDQGRAYRGSYSGGVNDQDGAYITPASYQGAAGTSPGSPGAGAQPGAPGAGVPGTPGSGIGTPGAAPGSPQGSTPTPGTTPGGSYGTGAGIPGTGGYSTSPPPGSSGSTGYGGPSYQGYSSPGAPGSTTPGTAPGLGTTPSTPGAPGVNPPGATTPGAPGSPTPGAVTTTPSTPTGPRS